MRTRNRESKKVKSIAEVIRKQIISGQYSPGSILPNRDQLIDELGASRVTVQKSMTQLLEEGFIETNGRHGTSVSMTPPHQYQIGLVLYENATGSKVFDAVEESIKLIEKETSYRFKIYRFLNGFRPQLDVETLKNDMEDNLLAGVFCFYIQPFLLEDYGILNYKNIPMMFLVDEKEDNRYQESHINFISLSYEALIDRAIKNLNFQKVAWIVNSYFQDYRKTYLMEECEANGIHTKPYWIQGCGLDKFSQKWLVNTIQLLMSSDRPEAIVVLDENLLDAVLSGLKQLELRVPDDVQLISHFSFPRERRELPATCKVGFDIHGLFKQVISYINEIKQKPAYAEYVVDDIKVVD